MNPSRPVNLPDNVSIPELDRDKLVALASEIGVSRPSEIDSVSLRNKISQQFQAKSRQCHNTEDPISLESIRDIPPPFLFTWTEELDTMNRIRLTRTYCMDIRYFIPLTLSSLRTRSGGALSPFTQLPLKIDVIERGRDKFQRLGNILDVTKDAEITKVVNVSLQAYRDAFREVFNEYVPPDHVVYLQRLALITLSVWFVSGTFSDEWIPFALPKLVNTRQDILESSTRQIVQKVSVLLWGLGKGLQQVFDSNSHKMERVNALTRQKFEAQLRSHKLVPNFPGRLLLDHRGTDASGQPAMYLQHDWPEVNATGTDDLFGRAWHGGIGKATVPGRFPSNHGKHNCHRKS